MLHNVFRSGRERSIRQVWSKLARTRTKRRYTSTTAIAGIESLEDRVMLAATTDRDPYDVDKDGQRFFSTDGMLLRLYLAGVRGEALIDGRVGPSADRKDAAAIEGYLDSIRDKYLDPDGDNRFLFSTDGMLLSLHIAAVAGQELLDGRINPVDATRDTPTLVDEYLMRLMNEVAIANSDEFTIDEDEILTRQSPGVLANDTDDDGDELTAELLRHPSRGQVELLPDGGFSYIPDVDFSGVDSFEYGTDDGYEDGGTSTVTITIAPQADEPVIVEPLSFATDNHRKGAANPAALNVPAERGLLSSARDADGDVLTVTSVEDPASGTVTWSADGSFEYMPADDFHGEDVIGYSVSDGQFSTSGTVRIDVLPAFTAPVVSDLVYEVNEDEALIVNVDDGLETATIDPGGTGLSFDFLDPPNNHENGYLGWPTVNPHFPDGSFAYKPIKDFHGSVYIRYAVRNETGGESVEAVAHIRVTSVFDEPELVDDELETEKNNPIRINGRNGVLANDQVIDISDPQVEITNSPQNGRIKQFRQWEEVRNLDSGLERKQLRSFDLTQDGNRLLVVQNVPNLPNRLVLLDTKIGYVKPTAVNSPFFPFAFEFSGYNGKAALSPTGKWLYVVGRSNRTSGPYSLRIWDAESGAPVFSISQLDGGRFAPTTGDLDNPGQVSFSPDDTRVAMARFDETTNTWAVDVKDVQSGEILQTVVEDLADPPQSVIYGSGGLAVAGTGLGITVWNPQTGEQVLSDPDTDPVHHVSFSPDGTRLATITRNETGFYELTVSELATGTHILQQESLVADPGSVDAQFSPDGKFIAAEFPAHLRVWNLDSDEEILTNGRDSFTLRPVFSAELNRIAFRFANGVTVFDLVKMQNVSRTENQELAGFSRDGRWLATFDAGGVVVIREAAKGDEVYRTSEPADGFQFAHNSSGFSTYDGERLHFVEFANVIEYQPDTDFLGTETLQYLVREGDREFSANVTIEVTPRGAITYNAQDEVVAIFGTSGDDSASATAGAELIVILDTAAGQNITETFGADRPVSQIVFKGYEGDDEFVNNNGIPAVAYGGPGEDTLTGGSANDRLYLQEPNQRGFGGRATGNGGDDDLFGAAGEESLIGGGGNDILFAYAGNDRLDGGSGDNQLNGGSGNDDYIIGNIPEDQRDIVTNDSIEDVGGENSLIFGLLDHGVAYDLNESVNQIGEKHTVEVSVSDRRFSSFDLNGTNHDDRLTGVVNRPNRITGGMGNDILQGGVWDDDLWGGLGNDLLIGGDGNDTLRGSNGMDTMEGGNGRDTLFGGLDNDKLFGGADDDDLRGEGGDDTMDGGTGSDTVDNVDNDTVSNVEVNIAPRGVVDVRISNDRTRFGDTYVVIDITGSDFDDHAIIEPLDGGLKVTVTIDVNSAGANGAITFIKKIPAADLANAYLDIKFTGNDGNDYFEEKIPSTLEYDGVRAFGGDGNDTLIGGHRTDDLYGGPGHDVLTGGPANDNLHGEFGNDTYRFTSADRGFDTLVEDVRGQSSPNDVNNVLDFSEYPDAVNLDLSDISGSFFGATGLRFDRATISKVLVGESGGDVTAHSDGIEIISADAAETVTILRGGRGPDRLVGGSGRNLLIGGGGNDTLIGGLGNDTLRGGAGDDRLIGGEEQGGQSFDSATMEDKDLLEGDIGNDYLEGGFDQDELIGGSGNDELWSTRPNLTPDQVWQVYLDQYCLYDPVAQCKLVPEELLAHDDETTNRRKQMIADGKLTSYPDQLDSGTGNDLINGFYVGETVWSSQNGGSLPTDFKRELFEKYVDPFGFVVARDKDRTPSGNKKVQHFFRADAAYRTGFALIHVALERDHVSAARFIELLSTFGFDENQNPVKHPVRNSKEFTRDPMTTILAGIHFAWKFGNEEVRLLAKGLMAKYLIPIAKTGGVLLKVPDEVTELADTFILPSLGFNLANVSREMGLTYKPAFDASVLNELLNNARAWIKSELNTLLKSISFTIPVPLLPDIAIGIPKFVRDAVVTATLDHLNSFDAFERTGDLIQDAILKADWGSGPPGWNQRAWDILRPKITPWAGRNVSPLEVINAIWTLQFQTTRFATSGSDVSEAYAGELMFWNTMLFQEYHPEIGIAPWIEGFRTYAVGHSWFNWDVFAGRDADAQDFIEAPPQDLNKFDYLWRQDQFGQLKKNKEFNYPDKVNVHLGPAIDYLVLWSLRRYLFTLP